MAAKRPLVLAAFKAALVSGAPLATGGAFLPWDAMPDAKEAGPLIQIEIVDSDMDDSECIGQWVHRIQVRIGAVVSGVFDYPAVWEILQQASQALAVSGTLGGLVQRIDITGAADSVTVAADKVLWPHLSADIIYLTPAGSL